MKHIVCTVTNDLTYDRRMQRICSTLAANGFAVTLVGRELPESVPLKEQPFRQKRLRCLFHKGKLFYIEYNLRLFFFLLFFKADIFCAVDLDTIAPVFTVAGLRGKKKVYDAHEYFSEVPEVVHRPVVKRIWEEVARIFIPKAHLCYTVGEALAGILSLRYKHRFEVIRNVPPLTDSSLQTETGSYILYQGALNKGRGLEATIEAMEHINMPLKIAGEGDLSDELRAMVKMRGLSDKVEFLGFVTPDELAELTKGAYVGLNLLENLGLNYYYSLANKCFDYMHAGVPAINMDFPEYRALNEQYECSVLLDELKAEEIARTINRLAASSKMYNYLADNCREARRVFNWQKEADKLVTLYRRFER